MAARRRAAALLAVCSLALPGLAQSRLTEKLQSVRIDNFGMINENYFRGAQPKAADYRTLASLGIRTVIDLTRDGRADEQRLVEQSGMKFYRIPLTTSEAPSAKAVRQFLSLVTDPANQPVYVHCQGGRHRTGVMTAVYRMTQDGWTADRAYGEMKKYRFEGFIGHPALKKFVFDYYAHLDRSHVAQETQHGDRTEVGATK
jgi:protein tyrosine/serine phosphatase